MLSISSSIPSTHGQTFRSNPIWNLQKTMMCQGTFAGDLEAVYMYAGPKE